MNIILLSGGSGTRLWPLSNEVRSKQFLKILKKEDGARESMVERVYRYIKDVDESSNVLIATSESQVPQIKASLGDNVNISIEPCRMDTFPAIVLACSKLIKDGISEKEQVVISPVDPYVDKLYFKMFKTLVNNSNNANITLIGIKPTYPSAKYGYIIPRDGEKQKNKINKCSGNDCEPVPIVVDHFIEKPSESEAEKLIANGALWNSGVYCFKIKYILDKAKEILGYNSYDELYNNYQNLKKISIDYAVAENEKSINAFPYDGEWKDLGTWNTLTEAMSEPTSGNVTISDCNNTYAINELSIPLVAIGIDNAVIAATPDGILVADKIGSQKIKELVKTERPMYEKRTWGEYKVLDYKLNPSGKNSLTKELIIKKREHISYQVHHHRMEVWTIVCGYGKIVLDDKVKKVSYGDTIVIDNEVRHGIKALEELHIIEVQVGDELSENDIERFEFSWENI